MKPPKNNKKNNFGINIGLPVDLDHIIKISIGVFVVTGLLVVYKYIDNLIMSKNIREGLLTTPQQIRDCSKLSQLNCGPKIYTPVLGTCIETYGPNSASPDATRMKFCVDEPIPSPHTQTANISSNLQGATCNALHTRHSSLQNKAITQCGD